LLKLIFTVVKKVSLVLHHANGILGFSMNAPQAPVRGLLP
jgi:hypothetical protein